MIKYLTLLLVSICLPSFADTSSIQQKLAELEASSGGRIGISAINTANNAQIQYRADERFPFQSTFKAFGAAAILKKSETDSKLLQQKIVYNKQDLVFWSPITEKHLAEGMTLAELCAATVMYSDNTAINLLIKKMGSLEAMNAFMRSIGDKTFRLDNWEPSLNSNPKDVRDTSTPNAMTKILRELTLGNSLAVPQREQLIAWMKGNTTGDNRIRAGVPKGWEVADKTGGGTDYGTTNDIGVIYPPKCAPIVISLFFIQKKKDAPRREDILASATRLLIQEFSQKDSCLAPL